MEYRNLGNSGLKVSVLGLGYSTTGLDKTIVESPEYEQKKFEEMNASISQGINFFDTAQYYGSGYSEIILGRNLKQGGWDRDDLVISTKLHPSLQGIQGFSRKGLRSAIEGSLKRLQLDTIDLLFHHRVDPQTPLLEQISTMNEFIENEKIFYWGTGECLAAKLEEIMLICDKHGYAPPICDQLEYSMLQRQKIEVDHVPLFDKYRLGAVVYSPAAGGILSGRFNDGSIPPGSKYLVAPWCKDSHKSFLGWRENNGSEMLRGLKEIADEIGCTQNQLALAWVLKNRDISTALFGVRNTQQVADNVAALAFINKLTPGILQRIEDLIINRPTPAMNFRDFTAREPRR